MIRLKTSRKRRSLLVCHADSSVEDSQWKCHEEEEKNHFSNVPTYLPTYLRIYLTL